MDVEDLIKCHSNPTKPEMLHGFNRETGAWIALTVVAVAGMFLLAAHGDYVSLTNGLLH